LGAVEVELVPGSHRSSLTPPLRLGRGFDIVVTPRLSHVGPRIGLRKAARILITAPPPPEFKVNTIHSVPIAHPNFLCERIEGSAVGHLVLKVALDGDGSIIAEVALLPESGIGFKRIACPPVRVPHAFVIVSLQLSRNGESERKIAITLRSTVIAFEVGGPGVKTTALVVSGTFHTALAKVLRTGCNRAILESRVP
jgi:hypothetical protein